MEYRIFGEPFPVVQCNLQPGEAMRTEKGSMAWMSNNLGLRTEGGGNVGRALGRMFSGESIFQNIYTAENGPASIAFASSFPGSIRAVQLSPGASVICQKSVFLASEMGVELRAFGQTSLGKGLFGGEGFIMQRLSGNGMVFLELNGHAVDFDLKPGETIVLKSGNLAVMDESCTMEIQQVKGLKNKLLGGQGFFNTSITGPGHVVVQTMTIGGLASELSPYIASSSGGAK